MLGGSSDGAQPRCEGRGQEASCRLTRTNLVEGARGDQGSQPAPLRRGPRAPTFPPRGVRGPEGGRGAGECQQLLTSGPSPRMTKMGPLPASGSVAFSFYPPRKPEQSSLFPGSPGHCCHLQGVDLQEGDGCACRAELGGFARLRPLGISDLPRPFLPRTRLRMGSCSRALGAGPAWDGSELLPFLRCLVHKAEVTSLPCLACRVCLRVRGRQGPGERPGYREVCGDLPVPCTSLLLVPLSSKGQSGSPSLSL